LGAAVIDDVLGIVALSVLLTVTRGTDPLSPFLHLLVYAAAVLLMGRFVVPRYVHWAQRILPREAVFTIVVSVVFVCAWSAEALGGLAAITGAYFAGVMIAQTDVAEASREATRAVGDGLLIPLFFVSVGLQAE